LNISVTGPRGADIDAGLTAYTMIATKSFAKQLGISRLKTNIVVRIHLGLSRLTSIIVVRIHEGLTVDRGQSEGLCEALDNRSFIIDVALFGNWLSTLAHEMVHVKQFAKGELDSALTQWKSNKYCENIDYWDQPWEKEARRLQNKLVLEFEKV
jgi:hypothetical protein